MSFETFTATGKHRLVVTHTRWTPTPKGVRSSTQTAVVRLVPGGYTVAPGKEGRSLRSDLLASISTHMHMLECERLKAG
jgi:hypothetical protein